jgi:hypothetical protein
MESWSGDHQSTSTQTLTVMLKNKGDRIISRHERTINRFNTLDENITNLFVRDCTKKRHSLVKLLRKRQMDRWTDRQADRQTEKGDIKTTYQTDKAQQDIQNNNDHVTSTVILCIAAHLMSLPHFLKKRSLWSITSNNKPY